MVATVTAKRNFAEKKPLNARKRRLKQIRKLKERLERRESSPPPLPPPARPRTPPVPPGLEGVAKPGQSYLEMFAELSESLFDAHARERRLLDQLNRRR